MLSAAGASACRFRSPRFVSGRRGRARAWERRAAKRGLGPGDRTRLAAGLGAELCGTLLPGCLVTLGSCTLGCRASLHGAGHGARGPGGASGRMLTRPRLGRYSPAHPAAPPLPPIGAGSMQLASPSFGTRKTALRAASQPRQTEDG